MPVSTPPEVYERAEKILSNAFNAMNRQSSSVAESPASAVNAYLDKPLFEGAREYLTAISKMDENVAVALAAIQKERVVDAAKIVELALRVAEFATSDEKKDFRQLLNTLVNWNSALGSAVDSTAKEIKEISARQASSRDSDTTYPDLEPPPRQTVASRSEKIMALDRDLTNGTDDRSTMLRVYGFETTQDLYKIYDGLDRRGVLDFKNKFTGRIETGIESQRKAASYFAGIGAGNPAAHRRAEMQLQEAINRIENATKEYFRINGKRADDSDVNWSKNVRILEAAGRYKHADAEANAAAVSAARIQGMRAYGIGPQAPRLNHHLRREMYEPLQPVVFRVQSAPVILAAGDTSKASRVGDDWDSIIADAVVAIRTGNVPQALRSSKKAATSRPDLWEGHYLQFLARVHLRHWSDAVLYFQRVLELGGSPDIHPASVALLLENVAGLEQQDSGIAQLLSKLDERAKTNGIAATDIRALLERRGASAKAEDELVERLVNVSPRRPKATVPKPSKIDYVNITLWLRTGTAPLMEAWNSPAENAPAIKASLLRKLSMRGCAVVAVPPSQTQISSNTEWNLQWVADLSAEHDPQGFGLLREAEFRFHEANPRASRHPTSEELGAIMFLMAYEGVYSARGAASRTLRHDHWKDSLLAYLKAGPSSAALWNILISTHWPVGTPTASVSTTSVKGYRWSYCIQLSKYLAKDYDTPSTHVAALLALFRHDPRIDHDDVVAELPSEDRSWLNRTFPTEKSK